jgi:hypothetical protein
MSSSLCPKLCLKRYALSWDETYRALIRSAVTQANKMVAEERMKVADLQEELRQRASEHQALKLAMGILEEENQRFRNILASASQVVRSVKATTPTRGLTPSPSRNHSRRSSKSSLSIPVAPSTPGSPHTSPQYLTPAESSPWNDETTYPGKTLTTAGFPGDKEIVQPWLGTRSPPPPLEVGGFADSRDSPSTPYYTSVPRETKEPGEGASTPRLTT